MQNPGYTPISFLDTVIYKRDDIHPKLAADINYSTQMQPEMIDNLNKIYQAGFHYVVEDVINNIEDGPTVVAGICHRDKPGSFAIGPLFRDYETRQIKKLATQLLGNIDDILYSPTPLLQLYSIDIDATLNAVSGFKGLTTGDNTAYLDASQFIDSIDQAPTIPGLTMKSQAQLTYALTQPARQTLTIQFLPR